MKRFKKRKGSAVISSLFELNYLNKDNFKTLTSNYSNVDRFGIKDENQMNLVFELASFVDNNADFKKAILTLLDDTDFSISDLEIVSAEVTYANNKKTIQPLIQCKHSSEKKTISLDFFEESNGTKALAHLYSKMYPVLNTGGLVIVDEIERNLHPYLIAKLISIFEYSCTNRNSTQLIFSTHQIELLSRRNKSQIFITEKDKSNLSVDLFRLDEIKDIKSDEDFTRGYLNGEYGGLPIMKTSG